MDSADQGQSGRVENSFWSNQNIAHLPELLQSTLSLSIHE